MDSNSPFSSGMETFWKILFIFSTMEFSISDNGGIVSFCNSSVSFGIEPASLGMRFKEISWGLLGFLSGIIGIFIFQI